MKNKDNKSNDALGIAPYGEAVNTVTKGVVSGTGAFLSRICLPAAEELGLLLKDKVGNWRAKNAIAITLQAEKKLNKFDQKQELHAHPRLVMKAIEEGSWSDDALLQEMWAGLLATSCSKSGDDDTNLIFINILSQLTKGQAALLSHVCKYCVKYTDEVGLLYSENISIELIQIEEITGYKDIHKIDRELDHLRALELIGSGLMGGGGLTPGTTTAEFKPSTIALQMHARCQGHYGEPEGFYEIKENKSNK